MRSLMWFRSDLRTIDNTALSHACSRSTRGVVGIFLVAPAQWRDHDWGESKVDFVLRNVAALAEELARLNIPLLIRRADRFADAPSTLLDIARDCRCDALFHNREYELNELRRDEQVVQTFNDASIAVESFDDQTILPPDLLRTGQGGWYTVFTPFKKRWIEEVKTRLPLGPRILPQRLPPTGIAGQPVPTRIDGFGPSPVAAATWPAGQRHAADRLARFIEQRLEHYKDRRDTPGIDGTSSLSPYLACGAISVRQCLQAALDANHGKLDQGRLGAVTWISELIWREFYRHVMVGYPRVCMHQPFKLDTRRIRWSEDRTAFDRWCAGRTGVPIVDAAMRQLAAVGWMHNRLRMIAAMFLTKDLLIDWRWGEQHFARNLVDLDLASNNGGWQWSASTGTDAAPYFRIFNPVAQSRRCDPDGSFIRRYVPELVSLDDRAIHDPSQLPPLLRAGLDYPDPIVDHAQARRRVLQAFTAIRESAQGM
jgi:deoxyribodipyrimidine photo-lyase